VVDVDGPRIERLEIEFRHEDEAPQEAAASGE
jgi:hypothetical protein